MKKVAVIGTGWVGKHMISLFPNAITYSNGKRGELGSKDAINTCDVAFICVPTPNLKVDMSSPGTVMGEGALDTSMVEEAVRWCTCPLIVIRSTVNPGTCEHLVSKYNKRIVFEPEYLGETPAHPMYNPMTRKFVIMGGEQINTTELIELYGTVYNANTQIRQVTLREAEIIKLSENRAIAFKVAECQELYDVCQKTCTNYYTIRDAVYSDDPRFNLWWTFIYPNKRGFNSKCIPKDIYAWCAWAESAGYKPQISRAILKKNHEWID